MDAEHAFEAADDATDCPADNGTDRSCRLIPNGSPMRNAVRNSLGTSCERSNQRDRNGACKKNAVVHVTILPPCSDPATWRSIKALPRRQSVQNNYCISLQIPDMGLLRRAPRASKAFSRRCF